MVTRLVHSRSITPPAIWGKLPGHADFVRSGVRHGESEGWQPWLMQQSRTLGAGAMVRVVAIPTAFVLPPGTLPFARRHFVIGVIAPSMDRVGRCHPLIVYQIAHPRWVLRHFEAQVRQPLGWQFWLARAVARHTRAQAESNIQALEHTVWALWHLHRSGWAALPKDYDEAQGVTERRFERAWSLLDQWAGPAPQNDPAAQLHGVHYLPWADWPQRLQHARAESAFWQQDAAGRFINAANRLQSLWGAMA